MTAQATYNELRTIGFSGMAADSGKNEVASMRNDEASAEIPFGVAVKFASASDQRSAKLLTATSETVAGILMHSHAYDNDDLGSVGVKPANDLNIMRRGRILVECEDGCNVGDRLFIRAVATGAEKAGALRASVDGTDTIDSQGQGVWRTSASAGGLAVLEFDFVNPLT